MPYRQSEEVKQILRAAADESRSLDISRYAPHTIAWAIDTGLGPFLQHMTSQGSRGTYGDVLFAQDLAARVESGQRLDALDEILCAAPALADDIVLLKGASLCTRVYPEPHLRLMGDIDLLVSPDVQARLEPVLRDLGYVQRSRQPAEYYAGHHHSMPFVHPSRPVSIEVHTALFRPGTAPASVRLFSPKLAHGRRRPHRFRAHEVNRLADEIELAYLTAHWLYERKCFGPAVIPILDLTLLLSRMPATFDWEQLLADLSGTIAGSYLRVGLSFMHDRLGLRLPDGVRRRLAGLGTAPGRLVDPVLHRWLDRYALGALPFGRLNSASNVNVAWDALLAPRAAAVSIMALPWNLLFPPAHPRRYDPRFQLRRLASMVSGRSRHNRPSSGSER